MPTDPSPPVAPDTQSASSGAASSGRRGLLLVVAAALVDTDGRVLLAQRPAGKTLAGLWEFPGGKLGAGESPEAALIRELDEELGITVNAACLAPLTFASHAYADFHLLMPLYICRRWDGMVQPREKQVLQWVRPRALRDYPMPPGRRASDPAADRLAGPVTTRRAGRSLHSVGKLFIDLSS